MTNYTRIFNNLITGNTATSEGNAQGGGGILCDGGSPAITNNTIAGNAAPPETGYQGGGGILCTGGSPAISNNIVAFNSSGLSNPRNGTIALKNNCVCNPGPNYTGLSAGAGDISVNPLFVGFLGNEDLLVPGNPLFVNPQEEDYRLAPDSPCIDAGNNAAVPTGELTDRAGHLRFFDDPATPDCRWSPGNCGTAPVVDMGAYEFIPAIPGDFNDDGLVDGRDRDIFAACVTGAAIPYAGGLPTGCSLSALTGGFIAADFDKDGDVDQSDFGVFQKCFSGPDQPGDPNCAK